VLDIQKALPTRITSNPAADLNPVWSPDSRTIVFASNRDGRGSLYQRAFGVVGEDNLLLRTDNLLPRERSRSSPWSWSRDGQYLAFKTFGSSRNRTLWALQLFGERKPLRIAELLRSDGYFLAVISPDGRWIAYQSDESGQNEVIIQSFPGPGLKQQVSTAGGFQPCWDRDGKELFYVAPNGTLMSVAITPARSSLELSAPRPLFQARLAGGFSVNGSRQYDVSADGRFLMNITQEQTTPITVVLNWFAQFKK
jgi:Tol biopolymer transport system component